MPIGTLSSQTVAFLIVFEIAALRATTLEQTASTFSFFAAIERLANSFGLDGVVD
jgi:hypothetical protein